jgi:hypothetical protein
MAAISDRQEHYWYCAPFQARGFTMRALPTLLAFAVAAVLASPVLATAPAIEGVVITVKTDTASWTSRSMTFDADDAYFTNPSANVLKIVPGTVGFVEAEVPVDCGVNDVVITEPSGVTSPPTVHAEIDCGGSAAREFVNVPVLASRPCLDSGCLGKSTFTARYAAAYGELYMNNTQVKFDWWVNRTADGLHQHNWSSGWVQTLPYVPQPTAPPDWVVTCPGDYTAVVKISTYPDMAIQVASTTVSPTCIP